MQLQSTKGLYIITEDSLEFDTLLLKTEQALMAGAEILQYRNKIQDYPVRVKQAQEIQSLCHDYKATFIINDDVVLAREIKADGVHLGTEDMQPQQARSILGKDSIIGVSCYNNINLAIESTNASADYIAFGPFFPSQKKPGAKKADIKIIQQAKKRINKPIIAIGGITPDNGKSLVEAGADFLASINAVYGAEDTFKTTQNFMALFDYHG